MAESPNQGLTVNDNIVPLVASLEQTVNDLQRQIHEPGAVLPLTSHDNTNVADSSMHHNLQTLGETLEELLDRLNGRILLPLETTFAPLPQGESFDRREIRRGSRITGTREPRSIRSLQLQHLCATYCSDADENGPMRSVLAELDKGVFNIFYVGRLDSLCKAGIFSFQSLLVSQ